MSEAPDSAEAPSRTPELPPPARAGESAESSDRVAQITSLLSELEQAVLDQQDTEALVATQTPRATASDGETPTEGGHENRLVQVRLGMASGLFAALQLRHPDSASHCLRVALGCSSWAFYKRLDSESHDIVELAALLHDVGNIGIADQLLHKTEALSEADQAEIAARRMEGLKVLRWSGCSQQVLNVVRCATARFDGLGTDPSLKGEKIPLEARMIAIVDAFDSLTADGAEQRGLSRDRALEELHQRAGTQFDPILVKQFSDLLLGQQEVLTERVASRWLREMNSASDAMPWDDRRFGRRETSEASKSNSPNGRSLFEEKLIDAMHDGVMFVDAEAQIQLWSKGSERLTGVSGAAAVDRNFTPGLLDMCNSAGRRVADEACPVARSLQTRSQLRQRVQILGRHGRHTAIDLHAIPVIDAKGVLLGATVLFHDAQSEATLEEKCEALHAKVTLDPMTQVANRAEFDRMERLFIETHLQAGLPCSLIMIDIDHFKNINDTYGHQAGDEAIITVANLLKSMCRSGDIVARYGGEEFALLCADCSIVAAGARAEQIRRKLSEIPHAALGNKRISASFGVTELEPCDSAESMLRRADRALLMAKQQGRNQVVELGKGMENIKPRKKRWWSFAGLKPSALLETKMTSKSSVDLTIEKLRGFVTDHHARIVSTADHYVELEIASTTFSHNRRRSDREMQFRVEIELTEERRERTNALGLAGGAYVRTTLHIVVRPKRNRCRRDGDMNERARLLTQSLKSYLMAHEDDGTPEDQPTMFQPSV